MKAIFYIKKKHTQRFSKLSTIKPGIQVKVFFGFFVQSVQSVNLTDSCINIPLAASAERMLVFQHDLLTEAGR